MANRNRFQNNDTRGWQSQPSRSAFEGNFRSNIDMNSASTSRGLSSGQCGRGGTKHKKKNTNSLVRKQFNPDRGEPGGPADPLKVGMRGILQKWYMRFLQRGFTPIVARQMALDRSRLRSCRNKRKNEARLEAELDAEAAANRHNGKLPSIKVAVLPTTYPNRLLNFNELSHLQKIIMDEMLKDGHGLRIKFNDVEFRPGLMLLDCRSTASVRWLEIFVPKLGTVCCPAWKGPKLITCMGRAIPLTPCITILLPNCENDFEKSKVLSFLGAQNENLNVRYWRIILHNKQSDGMLMTIVLDEPSLNSIKENQLMIHYKFGRVAVHVNRYKYEKIHTMCKKNTVQMSKVQLRRTHMEIAKQIAEQAAQTDSDDDESDDFDYNEDDSSPSHQNTDNDY